MKCPVAGVRSAALFGLQAHFFRLPFLNGSMCLVQDKILVMQVKSIITIVFSLAFLVLMLRFGSGTDSWKCNMQGAQLESEVN